MYFVKSVILLQTEFALEIRDIVFHVVIAITSLLQQMLLGINNTKDIVKGLKKLHKTYHPRLMSYIQKNIMINLSYILYKSLFVVYSKLEENIMRVVNFSEARNNFKKILDQVSDDADYTIISRRDSEDAVVMSLDQFNGLMETVHLLSSPANAKHLEKSIEQYRSGKTETHELIDD